VIKYILYTYTQGAYISTNSNLVSAKSPQLLVMVYCTTITEILGLPWTIPSYSGCASLY